MPSKIIVKSKAELERAIKAIQQRNAERQRRTLRGALDSIARGVSSGVRR